MQVFGTLKLLVVLLGPSWLLWGRSGPKKAPKIGPQALNGQQEAQAQPAGALLEALVSKMAPRWLQDGSKLAQDGPKWSKIACWEPFWFFRDCLGRPWTPEDLQKPMV